MSENLTDDGWKHLSVPIPPELVALGVDADIKRFIDAMIYKLRRNAHKGRWEDLALDKAFGDLKSEVEELEAAMGPGSTTEILFEAADVANEALIIAAIGLERAGVRG